VNFSHHCKQKIPEIEGEMEAIIEDIKERRYNTTEYSLDDETDAKAVECIPTSSTEAKERKKVVGLDDLNVRSSLVVCTHFSA
jgi:hypothetical protein